MTMSESVKISASLDEIWPFVADPVGQATWNDKIVEVDRTSDLPVTLGEHFKITYRMSGKDRKSNVEVIACSPPCEVHFRHQYEWKSRRSFVEERYTLQQVGDQVKVTQQIDMAASGIPWIFRVLIWLISRFGKSVDQSSMGKLKEVVENSVGQQ